MIGNIKVFGWITYFVIVSVIDLSLINTKYCRIIKRYIQFFKGINQPERLFGSKYKSHMSGFIHRSYDRLCIKCYIKFFQGINQPDGLYLSKYKSYMSGFIHRSYDRLWNLGLTICWQAGEPKKVTIFALLCILTVSIVWLRICFQCNFQNIWI
jgi:hypothetical protein